VGEHGRKGGKEAGLLWDCTCMNAMYISVLTVCFQYWKTVMCYILGTEFMYAFFLSMHFALFTVLLEKVP